MRCLGTSAHYHKDRGKRLQQDASPRLAGPYCRLLVMQGAAVLERKFRCAGVAWTRRC
jgi:hypothetical protein